MIDVHTLISRLKSLHKPSVAAGGEIGTLEKSIEAIFSGVEHARRSLSALETNCLVAAIDALKNERFSLARANILHALENARHYEMPNRFPLLSVTDLRQRLHAALQHLPHQH